MVDDPCWCCKSLDDSLPHRSKLALSACRLDLVDFELNKVCDCDDHLGDRGLAVEHLKEVGEVGLWAGLWIKRLEIERRVTVYALVEDRTRGCGRVEGQDVIEGAGGEANGEDI